MPCVAEVVNRLLKADCTDFKNIDDCQQIGVKFERTFLKFATVDSTSYRLIIHLR